MKTKELERILRGQKCYFVRHGKRHDVWYSTITHTHFPVPRHGAKEVADGTLADIVSQSGIKI
ncbi:MAG: type II toxin-antitoxin system HicA family toxin [Bacteroidales bacterium]|nr:type II toxin-antitoxin system HicA family toxin [Bacteroidales bacterium]